MDSHQDPSTHTPHLPSAPETSRFQQWMDDPMRSVIVASLGTMSTLGIVLSGIWAINVALP